jgi:hypothetical protein
MSKNIPFLAPFPSPSFMPNGGMDDGSSFLSITRIDASA